MKNKFIIKYVLILICISILSIIVFLFLDLINITTIYPFTRISKEYDWLNLLNAFVGGLIGTIGTLLGIYYTINNEREINRKKDIEDKKRNGYSYVTFSTSPLKATIFLDTYYSLNSNLDYGCFLIGENVDCKLSRHLDFEFEFVNMNVNMPSGVMLNKITVLFNAIEEDNTVSFYNHIDLYKYGDGYKKITIKDNNEFGIFSTILINEESFGDIIKKFIDSKRIDIIADISFVNPNGVITRGNFRTNLILNESKKIGSTRKCGSNRKCNCYDAINNYSYVESLDKILYID